MSRRKNVAIRDLIESVNYRNQHSTCSPEVRKGWNSLLEEMLSNAGVYAGFQYLTTGEVPQGHDPGIIRLEDGTSTFPDESRIEYHYHEHLKGKP